MPELDVTSPQHTNKQRRLETRTKPNVDIEIGMSGVLLMRIGELNGETMTVTVTKVRINLTRPGHRKRNIPLETFWIIPNFELYFEEEQGWGGHYVFENGEITDEHFYNIPDWNETENDEVWELKEDFVGRGEVYKAGYYAYGSLHEFWGLNGKKLKNLLIC